MTPGVLEPLTAGKALARAAERLRAAGVHHDRREARLLLAAVLQVGTESLLAHPEYRLTRQQEASFRALVARRSAREPVSRILGRREFWGLDLRIGPATLDPRPDSETLIEAVLEWWRARERPISILDLGTGSGCLLLALLYELPHAWGLGLDIDPQAAALAQDNARSLGLAERAGFAAGDWAAAISGSWQVIVSNPPYIREREIDALEPEVARYEPRRALAGGPDGFAAYRAMVPQVARLLAPGGLAAVEVAPDQAKYVSRLLTDAGLGVVARRRDLSGHERCILAVREPHFS